MKKLILTLLMITLFYGIKAQTIKHHHYTTYYNVKLKEPDSVAWNLTPQMVSCDKQDRNNPFKSDPQIPNSASPDDYNVNKGNPDRPNWIDKGHLFSYMDAQCDEIDKIECFYMSNMLPQKHTFNAGKWQELEKQERIWAKTQTLHIIAGGIGTLGTLPAGENIPKYMYKAVYINGKYRAWIMPNSSEANKFDLNHWEISLIDLNKQTGLKL
jgi:endonuclease G